MSDNRRVISHTQGGFWGNSMAINQQDVILLEIVVSMQISVTFHTQTVCTCQKN